MPANSIYAQFSLTSNMDFYILLNMEGVFDIERLKAAVIMFAESVSVIEGGASDPNMMWVEGNE